jgi:hypothetical protein
MGTYSTRPVPSGSREKVSTSNSDVRKQIDFKHENVPRMGGDFLGGYISPSGDEDCPFHRTVTRRPWDLTYLHRFDGKKYADRDDYGG